MQFFKRITLFLVLNFVICITIVAIATAFNLELTLSRQGLDLKSLFLISFFYGMTGSIISLLLSKPMAKLLMGVKAINTYDCSGEALLLKNLIDKIANKAQLKKIPEIGIFSSDVPNAFATGFSQSNALVAVSTGLLNKLDEEEIEAVIAHEIAHIKNGDMVTMTLLQGVINTFVIFLSYILALVISQALRKEKSKGSSDIAFYFTRLAFQIVLMLIGSLIINAYSRAREYRADLGGAKFSTKDKMIRALKRLQSCYSRVREDKAPESLAAFMFNHKTSFKELFSTHPPLEKRIQALESLSL